MYDVTGFPGGTSGEEPTCQCRRHETWDSIPGSLSWEDPLEKGMTSHSNILAWKIPWTEEPFRLQSIGSQRVGHDWGNLACMHTYDVMCVCERERTWQMVKNITIHKCFSSLQFSSVAQSCLTHCNPIESQHARPPCPSPTPRVYPNPCPSSRWCHLIISSSVVPFSSCHQSLPASGSFPVSQLLASGGQSTGVSASTSVLPMNIQDWFPLGWTGWISLQSKRLSRVSSNITVQKHQFFGAQLSL